jgi:very-short-patch-repair endonuclease
MGAYNRLSMEGFLVDASRVHGAKYDYGKVVYITKVVKVIIGCPEHGDFMQSIKSHLNGSGCPRCAGKVKLTINEFIIRSRKIHNDKYDYSKSNYKRSLTPVTIICPIHGEFEQRPNNHLRGDGCPNCAGRGKSVEDFIQKCNIVHNNKYDYIKVVLGEQQDSNKITIVCPTHGEFEQKPSRHLFGNGCPNCAGNNNVTTNEFIEKCKNVHGDRYDYSLVDYSRRTTKVSVICPNHGEFKQRPANHLSGQGCPICKESKGEKGIRRYLIANGIKYIQQHAFDGCHDVRKLQFDFYLPDYNLCIEYDGIQHFKPINSFGGISGYEDCKRRDNIKNEFCIKNGINLIRIPYTGDIIGELNKVLT